MKQRITKNNYFWVRMVCLFMFTAILATCDEPDLPLIGQCKDYIKFTTDKNLALSKDLDSTTILALEGWATFRGMSINGHYYADTIMNNETFTFEKEGVLIKQYSTKKISVIASKNTSTVPRIIIITLQNLCYADITITQAGGDGE